MTEPLTKIQLKSLFKQLQCFKEELSEGLKLSLESSDVVELDQSRVGRLSRTDAMQQQQMASAGQRRQHLQLGLIIKALQKIADEEYGFCVECGEDILLARLQIRPESEFCIACQNIQESQ